MCMMSKIGVVSLLQSDWFISMLEINQLTAFYLHEGGWMWQKGSCGNETDPKNKIFSVEWTNDYIDFISSSSWIKLKKFTCKEPTQNSKIISLTLSGKQAQLIKNVQNFAWIVWF